MLRYKQQKLILPSTEVIEFDNLFLGRLVVICKDASVGVFAFSQVKLTANSLLPLDFKTVCLPFPFLDENGGQLKLNAVKFLLFPPSERKDVVVERTAAVGTDIEVSIRRTTGFEPFYTPIATVTINLIDAVAIVLLNLYVAVGISFQIL